MVKITKEMSAEASKSDTKPVRKKTTGRKVTAKTAETESVKAGKTAATGKTASTGKTAATGKKASTGKTAATGKKASTGKTAAIDKTAAKKSAATKTVEKKAAPRKKVATGAVLHRQISSDERRQMIAETAYLRGESQGFLSDEQEDWLIAEAEVDNQLMKAEVLVSD